MFSHERLQLLYGLAIIEIGLEHLDLHLSPRYGELGVVLRVAHLFNRNCIGKAASPGDGGKSGGGRSGADGSEGTRRVQAIAQRLSFHGWQV